jgi:hypothetical protein
MANDPYERYKKYAPGLFGNTFTGGLLGNPNFLIGANIIGQGVKGQDPFSSLMPSLINAAKVKKAFAPSGFRQLSIAEKKAKGLPLEKEFQINLSSGKVSQIGGSGVTVNVGGSAKTRIKASPKEKDLLGYQEADDVVLTKDLEGNILADDLRSSVDTRMKNIGVAVEKSKLLEADDALRELENFIALQQKKGVKNLPGIGVLGGKKPDWAVSKDGLKNRALLAAYENITLKKRSGAAVTPSELARVQNELAGAASTADEEVFLDILRTNRKILEKQKKATFSIYRPEDIQAYQEAGGLSLYNSPLAIEDTTTTVVSPDLSNLSNQELLIEYYKLKNKR